MIIANQQNINIKNIILFQMIFQRLVIFLIGKSIFQYGREI